MAAIKLTAPKKNIPQPSRRFAKEPVRRKLRAAVYATNSETDVVNRKFSKGSRYVDSYAPWSPRRCSATMPARKIGMGNHGRCGSVSGQETA